MNSGLQQAKLSSYYPPRSRWYTRLFLGPGERAREWLHLDKFRLRGVISASQFLLSVALPGFAFFALGRRALGWLFMAGYVLAALVFVAALGYLAANVAYGLMISVHATSIIFLEGLWLAGDRFRVRLIAAICTLLMVWGLIYAPAVRFVENHWLMPLRAGNHVLVVHRTASGSIRRGDRVAYQISEDRSGAARGDRVYIREGFGIERVLATPGDRVRFAPGKLFINDQPVAAAHHMPTEGEFVVPEKVWFIWPGLDIRLRGGVPESDISAAFQRLAMVPENEIVGKAFKSWFGRKQSL